MIYHLFRKCVIHDWKVPKLQPHPAVSPCTTLLFYVSIPFLCHWNKMCTCKICELSCLFQHWIQIIVIQLSLQRCCLANVSKCDLLLPQFTSFGWSYFLHQGSLQALIWKLKLATKHCTLCNLCSMHLTTKPGASKERFHQTQRGVDC